MTRSSASVHQLNLMMLCERYDAAKQLVDTDRNTMIILPPHFWIFWTALESIRNDWVKLRESGLDDQSFSCLYPEEAIEAQDFMFDNRMRYAHALNSRFSAAHKSQMKYDHMIASDGSDCRFSDDVLYQRCLEDAFRNAEESLEFAELRAEDVYKRWEKKIMPLRRSRPRNMVRLKL